MITNADDYLMLSGIQHYYFCKRQWGLIHMENQWLDNQATKEGEYLHETADNPFVVESRKNVFISRGMPVSSKVLGLSGVLDVVEFHKNNTGVPVKGKEDFWQPFIVEYKRGKEKDDLRDIVQLVAEVISLEETLHCKIDVSYLFYNMRKKRQKVEITEVLRQQVYALAESMHRTYKNGKTSTVENYKNCKACSLYNLCLPQITKKKINIHNYIYDNIEGDLL